MCLTSDNDNSRQKTQPPGARNSLPVRCRSRSFPWRKRIISCWKPKRRRRTDPRSPGGRSSAGIPTAWIRFPAGRTGSAFPITTKSSGRNPDGSRHYGLIAGLPPAECQSPRGNKGRNRRRDHPRRDVYGLAQRLGGSITTAPPNRSGPGRWLPWRKRRNKEASVKTG